MTTNHPALGWRYVGCRLDDLPHRLAALLCEPPDERASDREYRLAQLPAAWAAYRDLLAWAEAEIAAAIAELPPEDEAAELGQNCPSSPQPEPQPVDPSRWQDAADQIGETLLILRAEWSPVWQTASPCREYCVPLSQSVSWERANKIGEVHPRANKETTP